MSILAYPDQPGEDPARPCRQCGHPAHTGECPNCDRRLAPPCLTLPDEDRLIDAVGEVIRPGGWLSGPCSPAPIVAAAVAALEAFADLDRLTAAKLLPMWRRYRELTPQQVAEVVAAFPAVTS